MIKDTLKKIFFPQRSVFQENKDEEVLDVPDFETFIDLVLALPEEKFYANALREDPIYSRMTKDLKVDLLAEAKNCGKHFAQAALQQSGDIRVLLKKSGLQLRNPPMPKGGGYVIFAQYTEPDDIVVFQDSLDQFLRLVTKTKYQSVFTEKAVKDLLIAHEYFHYLEYQNEATIITKNKKIQLWRFLGYRHMTTFISLSELSAMIFAKEYQSFPYSPFVLDCLLTYAYNKELSYSLYKAILQQEEI